MAFQTNPNGFFLIIKHPTTESKLLKFLARAILMALLIVSLSSIASSRGETNNNKNYEVVVNDNGLEKANGPAGIESPIHRRLLGYESDAKKAAALNKLEDVLLEPPRAASGKSRRYLQKTRYLPDLMGDSLESYPRHIFIDVGFPEKEDGSGTDWFAKNYPTRNKEFEVYKIETVSSDQETAAEKVEPVGISNWLMKNVRSEEYVVMKAEAEVVEEMMRSKAVRLVDELFLECKPQTNGDRKMNGSRSRRAYWQCLALYGQLRDEGVAVHQWWG